MDNNYPISKTLTAVLNSVTLEIYEGNIFDTEADILVNPANEKLENSGGLAKIISDQAGEEYENECQNYYKTKGAIKPGNVALTTSGKLNTCYRGIIHAVGPIGDESRENSNMLVSTLVNSFNLANKHQLASIAIPGISTGIYGYPNKEAARCHIAAFIIFAGQIAARGQTSLKCIKYVLLNPDVAECFANESMKRISVFHVFQYYGLHAERGMSILNSCCEKCKQSYGIERFQLTSICCKKICDYCIYFSGMQKCLCCQNNLHFYENYNPYSYNMCRYCNTFYRKGSSCKCKTYEGNQIKD